MRAAADDDVAAADDVVVLELAVDADDDGVRAWLHPIDGAFRGAVLAEFTRPLGLALDALAREAVVDCMPLARAVESEHARYAARRAAQPWQSLPKRLPGLPHVDAHVLYLEFAWPYMFVPGALWRLLAAWGLREPPACACPVADWAFTPTPPGARAPGPVALLCQQCWRRAPRH